MAPGRIDAAAGHAGRASHADVLPVRHPDENPAARNTGHLRAGLFQMWGWKVFEHFRAEHEIEGIVLQAGSADIPGPAVHPGMIDRGQLQIEGGDRGEAIRQAGG